MILFYIILNFYLPICTSCDDIIRWAFENDRILNEADTWKYILCC